MASSQGGWDKPDQSFYDWISDLESNGYGDMSNFFQSSEARHRTGNLPGAGWISIQQRARERDAAVRNSMTQSRNQNKYGESYQRNLDSLMSRGYSMQQALAMLQDKGNWNEYLEPWKQGDNKDLYGNGGDKSYWDRFLAFIQRAGDAFVPGAGTAAKGVGKAGQFLYDNSRQMTDQEYQNHLFEFLNGGDWQNDPYGGERSWIERGKPGGYGGERSWGQGDALLKLINEYQGGGWGDGDWGDDGSGGGGGGGGGNPFDFYGYGGGGGGGSSPWMMRMTGPQMFNPFGG